MSEQPATLAKEAKSIHQSLKELLKTKEPFDREVDFQRKNLRRRYLNLLLIHPYAKESKDIENHLWMQTSHAFIASFKQRIAALDRAIQNNARQQQQQQNGPPPRQNNQNNHGPVEHRKLLQRFRQFLADEERFWTQLVLRLRRSFAINEAQPALVALGLISESDDPAHTSESGDGAGPTPNGRNHFQFPPEDPTVSFAPTTSAERESHLAIFSKALVCLGDIARYREQHNESGGRPRAGQEDGGPARRGRNRRGGAAADIPRPRNYDKAQQCYEQARLLVPHEGNPSHQLAILASYQKDSFASLVHYYRALCVRQPYDTAAENLGTILNKVLETWKARTRRERENKNMAADQQIAPRVRIETFKERLVVLHALWRVGLDKGLEKMDSISRKHDKVVFNDFQSLVAQRHLPTDMISNAVVLSQGALWKRRMVHETHSNPARDRKQESRPVPAGTPVILEWRLLNHLLDFHCALLEVGKDELKDLQPLDAVDNDLAQRISATFRRMLPALRIASKWLRANFKYVMQDHEFKAYQENEKAQGLEPSTKSPLSLSAKSSNTIRFWTAYAQFNLALSQAFPIHKIPQLAAPLEEDVEMRGFLPLKQLMGELKTPEDGGKPVALGQVREQVHPNVEQLMRIRDLLDDAMILVHAENSPLNLINNHILFRAEIVEGSLSRSHSQAQGPLEHSTPPVPIHQQQLLADIRDARLDLNAPQPDEDSMTEGTDVLREAFDFLHADQGEEDEDQDDEIVWDPRAPASPAVSPTIQATPITPVKAMLSPGLAPRSPPHLKSSFGTPITQHTVPSTTAQDLLNNVMGVKRSQSGSLVPLLEPAPLQNQLLFGAELSHRPTQSIWSASHDEQPLMFTGGAAPSNHIYQTQSPHRSYPASSSQDMSASMWPSSYPNASQNSQQTFVGALPSASFALPPQTLVTNGHQRIPSASVAAQLFPPPHQVQHDPFGYSSPMLQQPIQRPDSHTASSSAYMNSLARGNGVYYDGLQQQQHLYHAQPPSIHDPRVKPAYAAPTISQVWGSVG